MTDFFIFKNEDKDDWQKNSDFKTDIGIRRGSRTIICAMPNQGKTNLLFNLITQSNPPYQRIYVYRNKNSKEYNGTIHYFIEALTDMPLDEIETSGKKVLIIMEDLDKLKKDELEVVDHITRYLCSHCGVSAVIVCQSLYSIDKNLRLKIDIMHFFPNSCDMSYTLLKSPIELDERHRLIEYVKNNRRDQFDFVSIDFIQARKYKLNMNTINIGFENILPDDKREMIISREKKNKNVNI